MEQGRRKTTDESVGSSAGEALDPDRTSRQKKTPAQKKKEMQLLSVCLCVCRTHDRSTWPC
jgi:hypothetical protein